MERRVKKPYVSPEEQMRGVAMHDAKHEYVPPVGPGSNSLPPSGDWRESATVRAINSEVTARRRESS